MQYYYNINVFYLRSYKISTSIISDLFFFMCVFLDNLFYYFYVAFSSFNECRRPVNILQKITLWPTVTADPFQASKKFPTAFLVADRALGEILFSPCKWIGLCNSIQKVQSTNCIIQNLLQSQVFSILGPLKKFHCCYLWFIPAGDKNIVRFRADLYQKLFLMQ